jgi:hypothetical protein
MVLQKNNLVDFILESHHLTKLHPDISKLAAQKRLYYLKRKIKKPKSGVLLGSEYCELVGIRIDQLISIVFPKSKNP